MRSLPTLEEQVKALEDEVQALKTSQPFYNGQFSPYIAQLSGAAEHDFSYVTNHDFSQFDIFITYESSFQDTPIIEPTVVFTLTDGTVLGIDHAQCGIFHQVSYGTSVGIQMNASTFGLPIGTTVYLKLWFIVSDVAHISLSSNLRP